MRRLLVSLLGGACFAAVCGILLEGILAVWLAWPALPATPLARRLAAADILYPQYDPACARFDAELSYVLRPGTCRFDTREFSTELAINSAGFRDDEASLEAPPIVVAGDSTSLGWGVAVEEAYPALLEARLGVRVLNTGVPSYGTRREIASLDRVDTSALSVLIVQFSGNDHRENKSFFTAGTSASEPAQYRRRSAAAAADAAYWPGKYTWSSLRLAFGFEEPRVRLAAAKAGAEAELFLHALRYASKVDLSGVHVIVFAMEADAGAFGPAFLAALEGALAAQADRSWLGRLTTVDVSADIGPELRFRLDGHLGAEGHRRVAERLAAVLAKD